MDVNKFLLPSYQFNERAYLADETGSQSRAKSFFYTDITGQTHSRNANFHVTELLRYACAIIIKSSRAEVFTDDPFLVQIFRASLPT